jgi:hypothetical protein
MSALLALVWLETNFNGHKHLRHELSLAVIQLRARLDLICIGLEQGAVRVTGRIDSVAGLLTGTRNSSISAVMRPVARLK